MPIPRQQFFDANGHPLAGGFLYSYISGTTNPQATFTDSTGLVEQPNPITLDASGSPPNGTQVWLGPTFYKICLQNSQGAQQWCADNVSSYNLPFITTLSFLEGTAPTGVVGSCLIYGLTSLHRLAFNCNDSGTPDLFVGQNTVDVMSNKTLQFPIINNPTIFSPTVTGIEQHNGTSNATLFELNNSVIMDGVTYVFTDAGFQNALNAANVAGNTTLIIPSSLTLSNSHTITGDGVKIECWNNSTFTYTATGRIRMQGVGDGIRGCNFAGPGVGTLGTNQVVTMEASNQFFRNNMVTGFGSVGGSGELEVFGGSNHEISGNIFDNNADIDIFVNNTTAALQMNNIRIHDNYAGEIVVHETSGANSQINHMIVANNILHAGQNGKTEFCEEIGNFTAVPPTAGTLVSDVNSNGNHCYLTANGTFGGFSIGYAANVNQVGDTFDAEGFNYTVASFEHVGLSGGTVNGIISNSGTGGPGFSCDRCSNVVFSGIVVNGFNTASNSFGFHLVVANVALPTSNKNVVSDLIINFSPSGTGHGIWLQCNAAGSTCNNNVFTGDQVNGSGTAGSQCVTVENDVGTTDSNQFEGIAMNNCQFGYNLGATSTTTTVNTLGRSAAITTLFSGSGTVAHVPTSGNCTMVAGTCAAQSFGVTYVSAPVCFASWNGTGALAGILKVPSTTTTVTPASSNGADTAVTNWRCVAAGN